MNERRKNKQTTEKRMWERTKSEHEQQNSGEAAAVPLLLNGEAALDPALAPAEVTATAAAPSLPELELALH
jgi:hypothetical protein